MPSLAPYSQDTRSIAIQTPLGRDVFLLRGLSGEEGISRLFRFDLELLTTHTSIDVMAVVGKAATLGLRLADGTDRYFNGIISRLTLVGGEGPFTVYQAEMVPWLWLLTRTTDCRVFQKLSVPAIVEKIFTEQKLLDYQVRLQKTYAPREYCVQYRETDFNFISRLLEDCGIHYHFLHENGKHTLVLADSSAEHRPVAGLEKARYRASRDGQYEADVMTAWSMAAELRPTKYTLAAYNFETPNSALAVQLQSSHAAEGAAAYEIYDYPGGYSKVPEGEEVVRVRIEEQEQQALTFRGTGTCRKLAAGSRFDLTDHPIAELNQAYVVTAVTHAASESSYLPGGQTEGIKYNNTCSATPIMAAFRPARVTPRPVIHGAQTAQVVGKKGEELWVDKHGRVKVQFHWDREGKRDENSSCWVRVAQNWAGKRWGTMFLPRIGQEVLVEFLEGDPDAPIITGRVYNGDQMPPYELPAEQTKSTLKSSTSRGGEGFNEWRFDDKAGAEQIFIHGQRDLDFVVKRQTRTLVGEEQHLIVEGSRVEQVGKEQHLKVVGDLVEEVGGARFAGAEKGLFLKSGSTIVLEAGGEITLKSSGGFITIGAGGVTIQGNLVNINSGGAAGAAQAKAVRAPNRATSAAPGDPSGVGGDGAGGEGVPVDPVQLYRDALPPTANISEADRQAYMLALAELQTARDRKDLAGMKAAQKKLDAILVKNGITPPAGADAAIAGVMAPKTGPTAPTAGDVGPPPELGVSGKTWTNRGQFYVPRLVSMLSALRPDRTEADWRAYFERILAIGFGGVRVFCGALQWANQHAEAARTRLPAFLDMAASYGMAVDATLLTDSGVAGFSYDPEQHLAGCAGILRGRRHVYATLANEIGHGTQAAGVSFANLRQWGQRHFNGIIWGCGAPVDGFRNPVTGHMLDRDEPWPVNPANPEGAQYFDGRGGSVCMAHLDRGRDFWNQARRVREIFAVSEVEDVPAVNAEPGRSITDPTWYALLGSLDRAFSSGGGVHHCAWGLDVRLPDAGEQARAEAYTAAWRAVDTILQGGRGFYKNTGHTDSPVARYTDEEFKQIVRHYSFTNGNRAASIVIGLSNPNLTLAWANGFKPVTGRPAAQFTKSDDGSQLQIWEVAR